MTSSTENGSGWIPAACTLPTLQQPVRLTAFDDLLESSVTAVWRPEPQRLRLELLADPLVAARAADLAARESQCCSFFAFTLTIEAGAVSIEVSVPTPYIEVLDGLAARAEQLKTPRT